MPNAPGQNHRKGISLIELFNLFPDEESAKRWWIEERWPDGVVCCKCGSDNIQERPTGKPQPCRCRGLPL